MKYLIEIRITKTYRIPVEAEGESDAVSKADAMMVERANLYFDDDDIEVECFQGDEK